MMAPQKAPGSGRAPALPSTERRADPASAFKPSVMTARPSRNSPTPPRMAKIVDMRVSPRLRSGRHAAPSWVAPSRATPDNGLARRADLSRLRSWKLCHEQVNRVEPVQARQAYAGAAERGLALFWVRHSLRT